MARKTCSACRADIRPEDNTWRCDHGARHCTRCYDPIDDRVCLVVHDPVFHAASPEESLRVRSVMRQRRSETEAAAPAPRRSAARRKQAANAPALARWIAKKRRPAA